MTRSDTLCFRTGVFFFGAVKYYSFDNPSSGGAELRFLCAFLFGSSVVMLFRSVPLQCSLILHTNTLFLLYNKSASPLQVLGRIACADVVNQLVTHIMISF